MAETSQLLSPDFMSTLENLSLHSRKIFKGILKGERRSKKKGISIEFADYRDYVPGDDLRFLDWNIFGRLDRLLLKMFQEEEDLNLYFLIDGSESMGYGKPSKFFYAKRLAAALGYIALANLDRIGAGIFSSDLDQIFPLTRGKRSAWRFFDFLENGSLGKETDMEAAFHSFALRFKYSGIVIIISDFMTPGFEQAFKYLSPKQFDVFVIQILSQEEVEPPLVGDVRLIDAETGANTDLSISADLLQRYNFILQGFLEHINQFCSRHDIFHLFATNQVPVEELLLRYLRQVGLLR